MIRQLQELVDNLFRQQCQPVPTAFEDGDRITSEGAGFTQPTAVELNIEGIAIGVTHSAQIGVCKLDFMLPVAECHPLWRDGQIQVFVDRMNLWSDPVRGSNVLRWCRDDNSRCGKRARTQVLMQRDGSDQECEDQDFTSAFHSACQLLSGREFGAVDQAPQDIFERFAAVVDGFNVASHDAAFFIGRTSGQHSRVEHFDGLNIIGFTGQQL